MPPEAPGKAHFQEAYESRPPWDIGRPQKVFLQAADQITGSILDAGCGTGENALYFAERGHKVTGIDYLEKPIAEAQRKAQRRGLQATFLVMDALCLGEIPEQFDSVIDCGLFQGKRKDAFEKNEPLSLMMTDIDHFKNFNDSFGHLTGDQVLRLVAMSVKLRTPTIATSHSSASRPV